ncbi:ABC transporter ATP-binding protein [Nitratireductor indicus]|uniref:ABC transporter n=1 Tax=Nitratireductor indicus C115 TaxID=1231190 RepID=K2NTW9_9HYPH|nr:ABC transporter ATP-binding protein [Nitratireductor indicus]EKF41274.1 ABC transporter [Nitratireductor indicus C115]MDS1138341.1 ABC transporter ATP-binding protein [Nitratireductor indicus]SFQ65366.1 sn-glycerol 3-phosphate transport system ATP-binding protein [Nitratireductor indicus]
MTGIEIVNLNKRWATFDAVKDVNFTVEPGTLTVLLGPSGCGKSTTLRLIAGLDTVTSGTIRIGGRDVTDAPPARRDLAMVFQSYALFPHLSVEENIVFGLKVRRVPADERRRRLNRAVEILGLGPYLGRKPSQLSGGQQQRVALGRAIVAEAPICLMDEPLSNLDAQLRHDMRREIRNIQRALGMTMVYVTHDQIEAMSLADQVILMKAGHIEQKATPEELYLKPATTFAARFIGTPPMNLVGLADGAGGAVVKGTAARMFEGRGEGLLMGLRPEQIRVGEEGMLPVIVRNVEYHGADSILECEAGEENITVRVDGVRPIAVGSRLSLSWEPEAMHVFDRESGFVQPVR